MPIDIDSEKIEKNEYRSMDQRQFGDL
jgi:hypothetical protein